MPEAAPPQFAVHRDDCHEYEAAGGEMIELREVILPVRIDQSIDRRKQLVGLMMVDRDHVEAELLGFYERRDAGRAAVDCDQQACTLFGKRPHRLGIRPVTLK